MTTIGWTGTEHVCSSCGAPWDGSEVTPSKLPRLLEEAIAAGDCTREDAYAAFLRLDDLANATVAGDITQEQGSELAMADALALRRKRRPQ